MHLPRRKNPYIDMWSRKELLATYLQGKVTCVNVEINQRCNGGCKYCYAGPARDGTAREQALSLDDFTAILGLRTLGARAVYLYGGDQLLHPAFEAIVSLALRRKFHVIVPLSGLVSREHAACRGWYRGSTLAFAGVLINIFYPYPESDGYRNVAGGIFTLFFVIMDLGTHMTMDRFIAEANIKDPAKMLKYIQYFIWYQMTTGLLQTTAISFYALFIIPQSSLSYGIWLMLIISTYQYPGYLGVFGGVLGSLQQYDKTAILGFLHGQAFQRITELGFVFLGRMWGMSDPAIGEIMGIAIGACIGVYVDDFFAMILSAHYFSKAMARYGIKARDCFRIDFDRKIVKECLTFGIKTGMPSLIGVVTGLVMLWEYIIFVPQYTTFATLAGLMGGIAGFVNWGGVSAPTPLLAESYLNAKKKLTQYYIAQTFRYITLFQFLFLPLILGVFMVLDKFFIFFNMTNYMLALPFFYPSLLRNLQQPYTSFADSIQLGTNHPTFLMIIRFLEELVKIFFVTLFVVWLQLPARYGLAAIIWILPCAEYPAIMFKTISAYVYINRKIIALKVGWWQTIVSPLASGGIITAILSALIGFAFPVLEATLGFGIAIIIALVVLLVIVLCVYLPLTALFGGWDTDSLREFKYAARMSGPSKMFVVPMYRMTELACRKSRLFNKHPIDATAATMEARELLAIKEARLRDHE